MWPPRELEELEAEKRRQEGRAPPPKLKVVVGARLVFADGTPDILAYPQDRAAWGRLTRLLTLGKRRADKGDCILHLPDLLDHIAGLNLIVMPGTSPRLRGEVGPRSGPDEGIDACA